MVLYQPAYGTMAVPSHLRLTSLAGPRRRVVIFILLSRRCLALFGLSSPNQPGCHSGQSPLGYLQTPPGDIEDFTVMKIIIYFTAWTITDFYIDDHVNLCKPRLHVDARSAVSGRSDWQIVHQLICIDQFSFACFQYVIDHLSFHQVIDYL